MLTARLKGLNTDASALDDMIELAVGAKHLRVEYETRMISEPEWLTDAINRLNREIDLRRRDELEKRLREARARKTSLMSTDEKRRMVDDEVSKLERELGIAPATK